MPIRPRLLAPAVLLAALTGCAPATDVTVAHTPSPVGGAPAGRASTGRVPLTAAISWIPAGTEHPDGYERGAFRMWTDADHDGCDTRAETLLAQAVTRPTIGPRCKLSGGAWRSYYDDRTVSGPAGLDIDHVVPLAEAWASGAYAWTPARRTAYANDLDGRRSLIAVTAHTNRSKGDGDPAEWMPPAADAQCTYAADWTADKLRWDLTADPDERTALDKIASRCPDTTITFTPAP